MDEDDHAYAVETTAEITMLRQAVAFLFAHHLASLPSDQRGETLAVFVQEVSDMPPADLPTPEATRFHEAVAVSVRNHVQRFAEALRELFPES